MFINTSILLFETKISKFKNVFKSVELFGIFQKYNRVIKIHFFLFEIPIDRILARRIAASPVRSK